MFTVRSLCISSNGETPIQEQLSTKLPAQFSKRKKSASGNFKISRKLNR